MNPAALLPKTAPEHLEMLEKSVSLMLWWAWKWASEHPEETFGSILETRVDVYRRTELHDGEIFDYMHPELSEPWQRLKRELTALAGECGSAEEFEARAMPLVAPLLPGRVERDLADLHEGRIFANYKDSCLHFGDRLWKEGDARVDFHIANSLYPRSIFAEPGYVDRCLLKLADDAERRLGARELTCDSWLNSFEGWTRHFPPVWRERMTAPRYDTEDHLGFWGQFLTCRQTFAEATGRKMRQLGRVPYGMCRSWCTIAELREWILKQ